MLYVTKDEFKQIKEKIPNIRMTITSKDKKAKRKKRWVEEIPEVIDIINKIR